MRKKFIIGGFILVLALGFLVFILIDSSLNYYVTVDELLAEPDYGESVRVNGIVAEGSIDWNPDTEQLRFSLTDDSAVLPVIYQGDVPHDLEDGKDIVVKGKYQPDNIFHASELVMKCASKYEAAD